MSFEAVVCPASAAADGLALQPHDFAVFHTGSALVLIRRASRSDNFAPELIFATARQLSTLVGTATAAFYDDRVSHREALLFSNGQAGRSYGSADELWVPLNETGDPVPTAPPLLAHELDAEQEYETTLNAIDLALRAAGFPPGVDCGYVRQIAFKAS